MKTKEPITEQKLRPNLKSQSNHWLLCTLSISLIVGCLGGLWAYNAARSYLDLPTVALPTLQRSAQGISVFDRNDKLICTLHADRDTDPVPLSSISPNLREAVLSAEDHNFYKHHGIDLVAIVRAFVANRKNGHISEGASTITQQLVRNLFLDKNDKSYRRKLREICLAWQIEDRYTKNKILETYLNEIYFGHGVNGIERAAHSYFAKPASKLSLSESAFLAGIIKSPTTLSLPENNKQAKKRQAEVLAKMERYGYISHPQEVASVKDPLDFKPGINPVKYPYYVSYAMKLVENELGESMWKRGYKVYTNLDPAAQMVAEQTLARRIKSAPSGINQAALVSMSLKDGAVLAMVGGVGDFKDNQWNRAIHPHTAGSSFKPFVYLSGLTSGVIKPDSVIADQSMTIPMEGGPEYSPKNFDGKFQGWLTVRDALCRSRNICAIRVAQQDKLSNIVETAQLAGIKAQIEPHLSIALGSCAVSPLDMATGYSTLARSGVYMPPMMLRSIRTDSGSTVRTYAAAASSNLPAEQTRQVVDAMQDVVRRGTGTHAQLPGIAVAGKTGTADKGRDIWFVGFTPDTCTAVWAGNDSNKPVKGSHVTGGDIMAGVWQQYMRGFYRSHTPECKSFVAPEVALIDNVSELKDPMLAADSVNSLQFNGKDIGIASATDILSAVAAQKMQIAEVANQYAQQNSNSASLSSQTGYISSAITQNQM